MLPIGLPCWTQGLVVMCIIDELGRGSVDERRSLPIMLPIGRLTWAKDDDLSIMLPISELRIVSVVGLSVGGNNRSIG